MPSTATPRAPRGRLILAFALVYVIWGSTYLAILYAVQTIPPFLMAATRFALAGALLYAWSMSRREERPTRRMWRDAAITGVLLLCGGNGAVVWAEQHVPSGIAALIVAVVPVWMVLIDWLRPQGARPAGRVFVGLALGLGGLVMLVGFDVVRGGAGSVDLLSAGILVAGSLAWAIGSIYNRHSARPKSALLGTGMQMIGGSIALAILALGRGEPSRFDLASVSAASLIAWVYLVLIGGVVGFTAYIYLLHSTTPAKASTYAYVNPVVAVFLGWAVAGEPVTARTVVAAGVILSGVALITLGD
jgi:drug/metabolite transporter (DMT)-like permease